MGAVALNDAAIAGKQPTQPASVSAMLCACGYSAFGHRDALGAWSDRAFAELLFGYFPHFSRNVRMNWSRSGFIK